MKKIREHYGKSQEAFAKMLGMEQSHYSRYERGAVRPGPDVVIQIATKLNVTTDYLLGLSDDPIGTSSEADLSDDELALLLHYRAAPDEVKRALAILAGSRAPVAAGNNEGDVPETD
ncbi:MAG: hypothetical protein CUN55_17535 [Phototrophicales bacterium]|nr:MAG: hypothetical protein CUN55_17535 [Phototrophicales bacterium]